MKLTSYIIITFTATLMATVLQAQPVKDSSRKQTVEIVSSYKPVLRPSAKINGSAAHLVADTQRSVSPYKVPAQNLFYTYRPMPLQPLALTQDTNLNLGDRSMLKAGIGNLSTPFLAAAIGLGDGKSYLANIYADYISSKGKLENQHYRGFGVKTAGSYFFDKYEMQGSVGFTQQDYRLYGYDTSLYNFKKEDILQQLRRLKMGLAFKNRNPTSTGINYSPTISLEAFSSQGNASESTIGIHLPASKSFTENFSAELAAGGQFTRFNSGFFNKDTSYGNNVAYIAPALIYAKQNFNIHAGVSPTWSNGKLNVLPNIFGEIKLPDYPFLLQLGYTGRIIQNTYNYLTSVNPWLQPMRSQLNTKETEMYAGIKMSTGNHFNISAKASFINYKNLPLFVNSSGDGKSFVIVNESSINNLRLKGDLSYIKQDKFTATAGIILNGFNGLKDNTKAWGMLPLEVNGSLRWWAFEKVLLKSDLWAFTGSPFRTLANKEGTLPGGVDLSFGAEITVTKKISIWMDVNNVFNNQYRRWNQYPVFGLNVLGGALIRF
jgi:hypothetical protein